MATTSDEDAVIKQAELSLKCHYMLNEALACIIKNSLEQAQIMQSQFYEILRTLERQSSTGAKYKKVVRKVKFGKFNYNIFYKEKETNIEILGIWRTNRDTELTEN